MNGMVEIAARDRCGVEFPPAIGRHPLPVAKGPMERAGVLMAEKAGDFLDLGRRIGEEPTAQFQAGLDEEIAEALPLFGDPPRQRALTEAQVASDVGEIRPAAGEAALRHHLHLCADRTARLEFAEGGGERRGQDLEQFRIVAGERAVEILPSQDQSIAGRASSIPTSSSGP